MTRVLKIEYTKNNGSTATIVIPDPNDGITMKGDIRSGNDTLAAIFDDFLTIKTAYYDTSNRQTVDEGD